MIDLELLAERTRPIQHGLSAALILAIVLLGLAQARKGTLVDCSEIDPALLQEPVQIPIEDGQVFDFEYAGEVYDVRPVAEYKLWGLVVSHNAAGGVGDVYHDGKSVDTKDIAVIWGKNLETNDFHDVEFWSGSWTAYCRWQRGTKFHTECLSNTHLITDLPEVRADIARVRVGDQVRVTGVLADYRARSHPDFWRKSSTVRTDDGNGACEVLFVHEIEFLVRGTPGWYAARTLSIWLVVVLLLAKGGLFAFGAHRAATRPPEPIKPPGDPLARLLPPPRKRGGTPDEL